MSAKVGSHQTSSQSPCVKNRGADRSRYLLPCARALIFLSATVAFYWSLMRFSHCTIAVLDAKLFKVNTAGLSTCMHLINVSLMVLHLAPRHLLQHSSQRHPLSFQMFTCPSKQTQPFGSFSCVPLDRKGLRRRREERERRRGV